MTTLALCSEEGSLALAASLHFAAGKGAYDEVILS